MGGLSEGAAEEVDDTNVLLNSDVRVDIVVEYESEVPTDVLEEDKVTFSELAVLSDSVAVGVVTGFVIEEPVMLLLEDKVDELMLPEEVALLLLLLESVDDLLRLTASDDVADEGEALRDTDAESVTDDHAEDREVLVKEDVEGSLDTVVAAMLLDAVKVSLLLDAVKVSLERDTVRVSVLLLRKEEYSVLTVENESVDEMVVVF